MGRGRTTATPTNRVSSLLQVRSDEEYGLHRATVATRELALDEWEEKWASQGRCSKIQQNSQISKYLEDFFVKKYHSFTSVRYPATGMFEKDRKTDRQNFFNLRPRTYGDEKENSSVFLSFWLKISTNSCTYQKKTVPLQRKG